MPKENNQRVMISKRLLKEGFLRLLSEKDLDKINVSELCEESGINRSTFYRYYSSPRDVLADIGTDMYHEMLGEMRTPRSLSDLEGYIEDMCTYLYRNASKIRILLKCTSDADAFGYMRELYKHSLSEYGKLTGISDLDEDSKNLMMTFFGGGGYFLLRQWVTEDIRKTPKEIASLVFQLICRGGYIADKSNNCT